MLKNAFGDMQGILCFKTFKRQSRNFALKRHFEHFHNDLKKRNEEERQRLFNEGRKFFLQRIKGWLTETEGLEVQIKN